MAARTVRRRVISLLTAALFGLSLVAHGFVTTAAAMQMSGAATSMQMAPHGDAMDCAGDAAGARATCFAACAATVGILCLPAPVLLDATTPAMTPAGERAPPQRDTPPDPHPPKRSPI